MTAKPIAQQHHELKMRVAPVFLAAIALYGTLAIFAQASLAQWLSHAGLDASSPVFRLFLIPLLLALPLVLLYGLIYLLICLRCPACSTTVRGATYRQLERYSSCPGCGCDWHDQEPAPAGKFSNEPF